MSLDRNGSSHHWTPLEFNAAKAKWGRHLLVVDAGNFPPNLPGDIVYRKSDPASMVTLWG